MYQVLLSFHSIIRWLLLIGISYCVIRSIIGLLNSSPYNKLDNIFRSFTSGVSHLQLIVGFILYFKSPVTTYFRNNTAEAIRNLDIAFFGWFHFSLMIVAVLLLTIGAAKAKRAKTDLEKHRQILWWFSAATLLIFLAIPWPFSPFVARPFIRPI